MLTGSQDSKHSPINPSIGKTLRQWRQARHLTAEKAAEKMNISKSALIKAENGERRLPSSCIEKLAQLYGFEINYVRRLVESKADMPALLPIQDIEWAFSCSIRHPMCRELQDLWTVAEGIDIITKATLVLLFEYRMGRQLLEDEQYRAVTKYLGIKNRRDKKFPNLLAGQYLKEELISIAARRYVPTADIDRKVTEEKAIDFIYCFLQFKNRFFPTNSKTIFEEPGTLHLSPFEDNYDYDDACYDDDYRGEENLQQPQSTDENLIYVHEEGNWKSVVRQGFSSSLYQELSDLYWKKRAEMSAHQQQLRQQTLST